MSLPKHLQGMKLVVKNERRVYLQTEVVLISPRKEDTANIDGSSVRGRLLQESMDREGYGKVRYFDANAKGGSGKKPFTKAEATVAKIAHSIER